MIEHLKVMKNENEIIKSELFKCKYKKSHCEDSKEFRKAGNCDKKCIAVEIENLHLKSEIHNLKVSNQEKVGAIQKLEREMSDSDSSSSDSLEYDDEDLEKNSRPLLGDASLVVKCEFCKYSFGTKYYLKNHIAKDHLGNMHIRLDT